MDDITLGVVRSLKKCTMVFTEVFLTSKRPILLLNSNTNDLNSKGGYMNNYFPFSVQSSSLPITLTSRHPVSLPVIFI